MPEPSRARRVIVLGSTGSVGAQTLEVIDHLNALHARGEFPHEYRVVGLAAGRGSEVLEAQRRHHSGARVAVANGAGPGDTACFTGPDAAERLVREVPCDLVVSAIAGSAGLGPTFAAVRLGRHVALANKESLVAAGALIVPEANRTGARLLPIDSEHAGVWQCLAGLCTAGEPGGAGVPPLTAPAPVRWVWITSSGGALRDWPTDRAYHATPEEALRHPTWSMGPKVTIDSATLMNKALELIEAHWLFGLGSDRMGVLIHPQSIVHAMVETADGGVMAQLAAPDMQGPIQHALTWPGRAPGSARTLHWAELNRLDFRYPEGESARAIGLAHVALNGGGTAGAVLNAANEVAVEAFLSRRIPFGRIVELVAEAMDAIPPSPLHRIDDATGAAGLAGRFVRERLGR